MKTKLFPTILTLLILTACAVPASPEPELVDPYPSPTEATEDGVHTLAWLASLPPQTLILQQEFEPTFFRLEAMHAFGREPVFALYADGTLVYTDEGPTYDQQRVMTVRLTPEETLALVNGAMAAGFQGLESHTDFCFDQPDGTQMCVADASYTIFRAIQPDGSLREVRIYADFANDPAAFAALTGLMQDYTHPAAEAYVPADATLFLRELPESTGLSTLPWPLAAEWITGLAFDADGLAVVVLSGDELTTFLEAAPRNVGDMYFELDGAVYGAYFVPWLPGADYTADIEAAFPQ